MKTHISVSQCCLLVMMILLIAFLPETLAQKMAVTTSSDKALLHYCKGKDMLQLEKYADARMQFDSALSIDPDFAMACILRAESSDTYDDFFLYSNKGIALVDKLPLSEKNFILYVKANHERNWNKKMEYLTFLLEFYPNDPWFHEMAGDHYFYYLKNYSEALPFYLKAIELGGDKSTVYGKLGANYQGMKEYDKAEEAFLKFIQTYSDEYLPYNEYGKFLLSRGDHDNSVTQFQTALEKDPHITYPYKGIGDNYILMGEYDKARETYQRLYDTSDNSLDKYLAIEFLAYSWLHQGDAGKALVRLNDYERMAIDNNQPVNEIRANFLRGYILCETGNPDEAQKYITKSMAICKEKAVDEEFNKDLQLWVRIMNCNVQLQKGDVITAQKEMAQCEKMKDRDLDYDQINWKNQLCGRMEMQKGNFQQAMSYLLKADQDNPMTMYYKALLYEKMGQNEMADEMKQKIRQVRNFDLYTATAVNLIK